MEKQQERRRFSLFSPQIHFFIHHVYELIGITRIPSALSKKASSWLGQGKTHLGYEQERVYSKSFPSKVDRSLSTPSRSRSSHPSSV